MEYDAVQTNKKITSGSQARDTPIAVSFSATENLRRLGCRESWREGSTRSIHARGGCRFETESEVNSSAVEGDFSIRCRAEGRQVGEAPPGGSTNKAVRLGVGAVGGGIDYRLFPTRETEKSRGRRPIPAPRFPGSIRSFEMPGSKDA
ncbi:unnamed protein product [Nesidiocoris tenuis]|uniref:Uncharacterized protein n=1 Tax=Nesidiocoris tenuis TaxID=355587 RepID=A0A6H5G4S6_9HEMI|nr:unnamed protein product [Nesidiocoris tenuis]